MEPAQPTSANEGDIFTAVVQILGDIVVKLGLTFADGGGGLGCGLGVGGIRIVGTGGQGRG